MKKSEELTKASYLEWQASLFGACFIAFGLGAMFSNFAQSFTGWIIVAGIALHSYGMYKIHQRNK